MGMFNVKSAYELVCSNSRNFQNTWWKCVDIAGPSKSEDIHLGALPWQTIDKQ